MSAVNLRVIHASMQAQDTHRQQTHDADAVFGYAARQAAVFLTGTEGGQFRDALTAAATVHGFALNADKRGDWTAVNRSLATVVARGYDGPHIPGAPTHTARGITWSTARLDDIGDVTVGAAHFLTDKTENRTGQSNAPLLEGVAKWGQAKGAGRALVIFNADVNEDDQHHDVFAGHPFTTCWDELKKWPATHGGPVIGPTIDISASYNRDGRVSAKSARSLTDRDLHLFTDHYPIEVVYTVTAAPPRGGER
jgi:hypothetical protein